jgi:GntR family transcriptional regulator
MNLNPESPIPLYHQLADILLSRIRDGVHPPGSRIPSEIKLAQTCQIGRPTVRQAIEVLVRKGVLTRRRGAGTFVCQRKPAVDLFSLNGTTAAFQKTGLPVTIHIVNPIQLKPIMQESDNPFSGQRAYFFCRLVRVDRYPVLIESLYLHADLFSGIDQINLTDRSLSEVVAERYYLRPIGGKQNFKIGYVTPENARLLDVAASKPILIVNRCLHFKPKNDAIYAELYCRTDRYVFSQTIGNMANG